MKASADSRVRLVVNGRFLTQSVTGVQRYAHELCATLDEALSAGRLPTWDVEIVSPPLKQVPPSFALIPIRQVGRFGGHLWEQSVLPRALHDADVLFCPGNTAPLASLAGRTPVVVTIHDLAFRDFPETVSRSFRMAYDVLVPAALRRADAVITVSEAERARIVSSYPGAGERLFAVANGGVPRKRPVPAPDDLSPPSTPFVLFVGALNPRKNLDGVMATGRRLLASRPELQLVVIGAGGHLQDVAGVNKVDDEVSSRIHFVGSVSDASLEAHYRAASLLLFPSFHEASGLPPVEAMAHGCPVVVSDIPALRERCGDAAAYCDPHDLESIIAAAARVLDEPAYAAALGDLGRQRAAGFTWANCLDATLALIEGAVAAPAR